ncbi:MAG: aspartyl protease family protein [Patescibacteria group bacterium]
MAELKFDYKNYGPGIYRPVVAVEIERAGVTVSYEVLVDSGADRNIFDAQLAEIMGFDVTGGRRHEVAGITGDVRTYYIHPVTMIIGGSWRFKTEAGFMPDMGSQAHGVVGQIGFFEFFKVTFDHAAKRIELKRTFEKKKE